jgi:hypothetical protein
MELGSWADWVGACGSVASTLLVGGALWWEIHRRRVEDQTAAAERRDLESAQARLVSVSAQMSPTRCLVTVTNDSDAPIVQVSYQLLVRGANGEVAMRVLIEDRAGQGQLISARDSYRADCLVKGVDENLDVDLMDIEVGFTDAREVRWVRTATTDALRRELSRL